MLKDEFLQIVRLYSPHEAERLWSEIEDTYERPERFYHNLRHLEQLYHQLHTYQAKFSQFHSVVFAIAYHDFVYDVQAKDNEEQSAALAKEKLESIHFPKDYIQLCEQLILATKHHQKISPEIDLFTDADLSILGQPAEVYQKYAEQIRNEYYVFNDTQYHLGRKKVLEHFLSMENIFKTPEFIAKYESQARLNLQNEINELTKPY